MTRAPVTTAASRPEPSREPRATSRKSTIAVSGTSSARTPAAWGSSSARRSRPTSSQRTPFACPRSCSASSAPTSRASTATITFPQTSTLIPSLAQNASIASRPARQVSALTLRAGNGWPNAARRSAADDGAPARPPSRDGDPRSGTAMEDLPGGPSPTMPPPMMTKSALCCWVGREYFPQVHRSRPSDPVTGRFCSSSGAHPTAVVRPRTREPRSLTWRRSTSTVRYWRNRPPPPDPMLVFGLGHADTDLDATPIPATPSTRAATAARPRGGRLLQDPELQDPVAFGPSSAWAGSPAWSRA